LIRENGVNICAYIIVLYIMYVEERT